MKKLITIFAVVLLSLGLFAMGTEKMLPNVDNAIATDGDNIPRDRRDPPPVMNEFQYNGNAVATDGDNIPRDRRDPPPVMNEFQYNGNAVATDGDNIPRDRRDPPPVMNELHYLNSIVV